MMAGKTHELLWMPANPDPRPHTTDSYELICAFGRPHAPPLWRGAREGSETMLGSRSGMREVVPFRREPGSIWAWLIENGMSPVYSGPGRLWLCMLDETEAAAFKLRFF